MKNLIIPTRKKRLKGFRIEPKLLDKFEKKIITNYGTGKINKALEALVDRFVNNDTDVDRLEKQLKEYFDVYENKKKIIEDVMKIVQSSKNTDIT